MRKRYFSWVVLGLANVLFGQQMPFLFVPGGPTNVEAIFQDHVGRLWVGGASDVACFDGTRFYSLREFGLPATTATAITEDGEGAIWIGTDLGVFRFQHGLLAQVMKGRVSGLAAAYGAVVASVESSLFRIRWNGREWRAKRIPFGGLQAGLSSLDHAGTLLISNTGWWGEVRAKDVVEWNGKQSLTIAKHEAPQGFAFNYLRDRFGCLWQRTGAVTTYQCPGEAKARELPGFVANRGSMWEGADGTMVFVNTGGLVTGRPGNFITTSAAHGLPDVNRAIIARDGTIWLGGAKGIYRWAQPRRMEYWTAREGFAGFGRICGVGNRLFAGNGQEGVAVLSEDRARWVPLAKSKSLGVVFDLLPDLKGGLFAGLRLGGVAEIRADGRITGQAGAHLAYVDQLARDEDGQVWAAGSGISRVRQTENRLVLEAEKLPEHGVGGPQSLDIEFAGKRRDAWACWVGGGVIHKESGGWRAITTKEGLRSNNCSSLAAMANGDVWVGYMGDPAFSTLRLTPGGQTIVKNFNIGGEFEKAPVMFVDADARGWLWRGTSEGVYVADEGAAQNNQWIRLDETDGLPNGNVSVQGFFGDADGSAWWVARDSSVVHFMPASDFVHPTFAPQVFVASFSWNSGAAKLAEAVGAMPHGSTVTAHIGTLQFDRRNALRLRYRVLPDESLWRDSRDLELRLGVVGWGDHSVEVQGRVGTGPWSGTAAQGFKVLRPFWATWPFLIGFALAGTAVGWGGYRWDRRRKRIERRALPDLMSLRMDAMVPEAHGLIGAALGGRFVVKEQLARGGFATVFDGFDKEQGCRCAVKVFHPEVSDEGLAQRFVQEVTALETVVHPNVVRIYGHGETALGVPYLVMEFVEGETLRKALAAGGLAAGETASLLRQIGRALEAIHAQRICHRDLKPDNLMIRAAGPAEERLVLIDFSIAIVKSPDKTVHGLSRAAGTIQYMAPEQAIGWADAASDIYSLAKVVMEMMTGKRVSELLPEASRDLPERVKEVLRGMRLGLSEEAIGMMGAALEFDPERRPREARAFAEKVAGDLEREKADAKKRTEAV